MIERSDGFGWFRLLDYGIAWKDTRKHQLTFSERNGYARRLMIGAWCLELLTPRH